MKTIDFSEIERRSESIKADFTQNEPFPHVVFDDLVHSDTLKKLIESFPDLDWTGWYNSDHTHQRLKYSCSDSDAIPDPLRLLIFELNSGPFVKWLSNVTGIPDLLPDPFLLGGGLHRTEPGGWLSPHTDFHVVKGLPLFRRVNLLLYLNPGWAEENGGYLELWDKRADRIAVKVPPIAGKCVIFRTDDQSMHGFSEPVAGRPRCSVAMYYYTAQEAGHFCGDGTTYWRPQSVRASTRREWLRLRGEGLFLQISRVASSISWRAASTAGKLRPSEVPLKDTK